MRCFIDPAQEALRSDLRRFTLSDVLHPHPTNLIRYTEGVKYLMEHAGVGWFVDMVAIAQPYALRDPCLCEFQLWEYWLSDGSAIVVCSRDSEDPAFRRAVHDVSSTLNYVNLYLRGGALMLPSEH